MVKSAHCHFEILGDQLVFEVEQRVRPHPHQNNG